MRTLLVIMAAFTLAAELTAAEGTIAPAPEAFFELEVDKTGLLAGKKHLFRFERYRGRVDDSAVSFTIDAASLKVLDAWKPATGAVAKIREVALGKDVLDAARYPEITFTADAPREGEIIGQLMVRGVSRPCTVTVKRSGNFVEGSALVRFSAFGIKEQKAALGAIGTKDEMRVRFRLQLP